MGQIELMSCGVALIKCNLHFPKKKNKADYKLPILIQNFHHLETNIGVATNICRKFIALARDHVDIMF